MRVSFVRSTVVALAAASLLVGCVQSPSSSAPESVSLDGAKIFRADNGVLSGPSQAALDVIVKD
ncbi:MAG: hypothetical protein ACJ790_00330, partial [Myxococcaceae bacterium]